MYNTGRALGLFLELLSEKRHCLPEPDVLIASVGTKVYRRCVGTASGEQQAGRPHPHAAPGGAHAPIAAGSRPPVWRTRPPARPRTPPARRDGPGGTWAEDAGYAARLSAGWDLEAVREACYLALASAGKEAMHFRWGRALAGARAVHCCRAWAP